MSPPAIFLCADGGLAQTGLAIGSVSGTARKLVLTETVKTHPSDGDDWKRMDIICDRIFELINDHAPSVIACEDHVFYDEEQSANRQFSQGAKIAAMLRGVGRFNAWSRGSGHTFVLTKSEVNRSLGLFGKVPKRRVRDAVELFLKAKRGGGMLRNEHEVDAAAVFWAAAQRWSVVAREKRAMGG